MFDRTRRTNLDAKATENTASKVDVEHCGPNFYRVRAELVLDGDAFDGADTFALLATRTAFDVIFEEAAGSGG